MVSQPHVDVDLRKYVDTHGHQEMRRAILHSTESGDLAGIGDVTAVAKFWQRQNRGYGAQLVIDSTGKSGRCANGDEVVWATENRNTGSGQIELVGRAAFLRPFWYGRPRQLSKVADWLAYWHQHWGLPLVQSVARGVSTHAMQTQAFHLSSGHTDPGGGFPLGYVISLARHRVGLSARPDDREFAAVAVDSDDYLLDGSPGHS